MISLVISFALSVALLPLLSIIAKKLNIVDTPDGKLKTHSRAIPYLGGVAIYVAVIFFVKEWYLFVVMTLIFLIGLIDDIKQIPWYVRFVAECLLGLLISQIFSANLFQMLFYTVLFVITVNAVNMIDGMDGICASVVIAGLIFVNKSSLEWALIGALIGYLGFNFPPAKVFMGDAGSYLIGCIVAYEIFLGMENSVDLKAFLPFWVIFIDILSGIVRRLAARVSPFLGDRDHIYDKVYRRVHGSETAKKRKTLFFVVMISFCFSIMKYFYSLFLVLLASIVVVLSLGMFVYDNRGGTTHGKD
ncbi:MULTISPECIES: glycosyltransferase family 4 protein [Pseudothermotoga]|jgi:UDP-N-acetylmuramyl pentapeptide phosphotransferase/UDP-N-acetylglucosamine-1-phosphate transferase|uniref:Glycosyl transferase family 4 n=1 Tax=Pseudothermotoga lettingae (strain ATCC BAA-301 / DSM 14385 / NBRC 107922 / TMO) TaxID=416591 RepID=A8F5A5_PSELT|nr:MULTISPECIES: MraY family glycosyltransferase [Pseudothermotoga]ABV33339.1 glycosyl transferase family 4 [Pseudothermotoga lettingae TMO]KUK20471.1 MAG: Glycosyl transferase family 4 [Pseudothermotoga lettingae]MDI3493985.1 hypothetical protein [Pseudothermotoga sp.]MDK2884489.1 hypothetical protein [Pseudothermotoga sp.]GLI49744.1 undecaprenyl-phosphate alpha-N-acetylglucosaminyl 1-phosphate transferase [Pseudothermotoga lettingae TMO]